MAKALPQAVPGVTPDDARKHFHVSRETGLAVVLVTVKVCLLFSLLFHYIYIKGKTVIFLSH